MIGVVFALAETLGKDDGLYVAALEQLIGELAEERSISQNGRALADLVDRIGPTLERSRSGLSDVAALLRPGVMSLRTLEARLRVAAVGLVPRRFRSFDDVGPMLAELRELGVPQATLGEGWSGVDHAKAAQAGFRGLVIPAEEIRDGDPRSLAAFANVASTLRLPADCLWFIGAEPRRDIAPARAAGFHTVWLNRTASTYPGHVAQPDHTIRNLGEFLGIISEAYMKSALTLREILSATLGFRLGHVIPTNPLRDE